MITRAITFLSNNVTLACDAKCTKAWGNNNRPRHQLSAHDDDYEFLADDELGEAPADPGTYEGEHGKPQREDERLNKWCARECERSGLYEPREGVVLPDFSVRSRNMPEGS